MKHTDNIYTRKVSGLIYEPTGECPDLSKCYDTTKTRELIDDIMKVDMPDDVRTFLIAAAQRHTKFSYSSIAEYYCHASAEVQRLMEDSALVVIDFEDAIAKGFVKYSKKLEELRGGIKDQDTITLKKSRGE